MDGVIDWQTTLLQALCVLSIAALLVGVGWVLTRERK